MTRDHATKNRQLEKFRIGKTTRSVNLSFSLQLQTIKGEAKCFGLIQVNQRCIVLDTFVECSVLKSFARGIEVAKVRYFLGKFTPQQSKRFFPFIQLPVSLSFMNTWSMAFWIALYILSVVSFRCIRIHSSINIPRSRYLIHTFNVGVGRRELY